VTLVGLNATTALSIRHDASNAEGTLPGRVRDPSDVDETIVDSGEWIDDHTTVSILAIVDHHESRVDARWTVRFVIDRQLIHILRKSTAKRLQIRGEGESRRAETALKAAGTVGDASGHGQRGITEHVAAKVHTLLVRRQVLFFVVIDKNSNRIDWDSFALTNAIDSGNRLRCTESNGTSEIVRLACRNKTNSETLLIFACKHTVNHLIESAVTSHSDKRAVLVNVNLIRDSERIHLFLTVEHHAPDATLHE